MVTVKSFFIKRNNEIKQCSKEEYDNYIKQAKKEGKKYLCADCKVCNCNKIRFCDIKKAEEILDGTYEHSIITQKDERGYRHKSTDYEFHVYKCKKFVKMKESVIRDDKIIMAQILKLDRQILELKRNNIADIKIKLLENKKQNLYNQIQTEEIKDSLEKAEIKLVQTQDDEKTLKLTEK